LINLYSGFASTTHITCRLRAAFFFWRDICASALLNYELNDVLLSVIYYDAVLNPEMYGGD